MMRMAMAALAALGLAACSEGAHEGAGAARGGYTLEVRASGDAQAFVVTAPDGRVVAAQSADGASALLNAERAMALAGAAPQMEEAPEVLALRVPGFKLNIAAADEPGEDRARVTIAVGDGPRIEVNARDDSDGDGRAHVRITGASAEAAREFIEEAEALSPEVKAAMRAELGL